MRKGRQDLQQLALAELDQVVLLGHVQVTSYALRGLLASGVDVALLTAGGRYLGRLTSGASHNVDLRRAQFRQLEDPAFALDLATRCVAGKVHNMRVLLLRHQRSHPSDQAARALVALRLVLERLDEATDLDTLRGLEGHSTASYFAAFGQLLREPGMTFERRLRRPPPDPVNTLLSFGYTLLTNLVHGYIELTGLDPYLGALHSPLRGRPSLALDLVEEFRPTIVDTAVARTVNTREITPQDFVRASGEEAPIEETWERQEAEDGAEPTRRPLTFTQAGVRKWLAAFERRLADRVLYPPTATQLTYRQIVQQQAYRLARHIRGEDRYEPFEARD